MDAQAYPGNPAVPTIRETCKYSAPELTVRPAMYAENRVTLKNTQITEPYFPPSSFSPV